MGRPRTPIATLKARGTFREDRHGGTVEYPPGKAAPPAHLSGEAKDEWKRQVKRLLSAGLYADVDHAMLAIYCEAWGEYVTCAAQIAEKGHFAKDAAGRVVLSPLLKLRDRAAERMIGMAGHFGFSPSTRARLKAPAQKDEVGGKGPTKLRFFNNQESDE